ncbi:MAG TPA: aminotransferase class III-fold pyridoxal phosphate-dependent enzyme [Gammaproteobacteria bacterium]|nr:aminotransferase class III-fold pyridoxal phosphate-dependent enzyme [Gammaproteobacteria bacterium]
MKLIDRLNEIRSFGGQARTKGLPDDVIARFAETDPKLVQAVDEAVAAHAQLRETFPELLKLDEAEQIHAIQSRFVNFYPEEAVNPYVSLAARGPWLVTAKGAVLHDSGGYGMLGHGHAPETILKAMNQPQVMANIMTPNFSQRRFVDALTGEIGHRRGGGCPFDRFLCMNSGSEAVTVGARISDVNAKLQTDPGAQHAGKTINILGLAGGFHGRTDRPAQFSDSSMKAYQHHLASFRDRRNLMTVEPNNLDQLREAFATAEARNIFIEAFFIEPVMGEGNPGQAITPEFYALARSLTSAHGSLLLVDSIQAGLRAQGCLSIVDYPGFENVEPPDMETYSKAINAGQYPLSVLAMNARAAGLYRKGIYGNTMTANPRAMDVGATVLEAVTTRMRENIVARGKEFVEKLQKLADEMDGAIVRVQGTGLLFSAELDPRYKCFGRDSTEEYLRMHGIGVIHGGANSLRYTPHFNITSAEVDLIVEATRDALVNGPQQAAAPAARASA